MLLLKALLLFSICQYFLGLYLLTLNHRNGKEFSFRIETVKDLNSFYSAGSTLQVGLPSIYSHVSMKLSVASSSVHCSTKFKWLSVFSVWVLLFSSQAKSLPCTLSGPWPLCLMLRVSQQDRYRFIDQNIQLQLYQYLLY